MTKLKSFAAIVLSIALIISLGACHPKNEVAMTIGDVEINSALYMCAFLQADGEGKNKVDESAAEGVEDINYLKQSIDGKEFSTWVKDRAIEISKQYAAYETKFKETKLAFDQNTLDEIDFYVDYYWNSGGFSQVYGGNGVSLDTYKKFFTYSYKSREYFTSIYGKDGTDPVPEETVKSTLDDKFTTANILQANYTDDAGAALDDSKKAELKTQFEDYLIRLNDGESFETIYKEFNKTEEETDDKNEDDETDTQSSDVSENSENDSSSDSSDTSEDTDEDEVAKPADEYAQVLGDSDTSRTSSLYKDIKAMKKGEKKLIELDNNAGLVLVIRQDIMKDPYYLESMDVEVLMLLKQTEFEEMISKFASELSFTKNDYAIDRFKVKNIKYPEGVK